MIINNNKITANTGQVLMRKSDKYIAGNEITLGYTYYIGGVKLATPHLEVPDDYTDVYSINVESIDYPVESYEYSYLKAFIVKIKYSNDDQIAIIANYTKDSTDEKYLKKYNDMQNWRDIAAEIAKSYSTT